ncbi:DUF389 domain-containing protein [Rhabdothermincola salaria]|uniref:DUF389 domain-containing protein n=1 Tax=Rhabdothermincola salaria TaxID=2903142 RepID=UPI001E2BBC55|nr:DUF389 domain-containing protein [Rhabdothermincola salaria]MCD9625669.1 DUF389 domain-containing protein [Rhabdothermincola salaria]
MFGVGVLVLVAPGTILLAIRAVLGATAIVIGLVLVASGPGKHAAGSTAEGIDSASMARVATTWLRDRRLAPTRRVELAETLFVEPPDRLAKLTSFWVMMLLSVGIASFAVVQNSTAVVIGAMLVAPLMAPIMGVAAGAWATVDPRTSSSLPGVAIAVALVPPFAGGGHHPPPDTESLEQDLTEAFGTPVTLRARHVPSVALSPGEAPSLPVDTGT